jgi:hypothetical protein
MTWVTVTQYMCYKWPRICSVCRYHNQVLSSFMTYQLVCNKNNTTGVTMEQELLTFRTSCCSIFSFLCSILYIFDCPFSFGFPLAFELSIHLRFSAFNYPFGIIKLSSVSPWLNNTEVHWTPLCTLYHTSAR